MLSYGNTQSAVLPAPEIEIEAISPTNDRLRVKFVCVVDTAATISAIPRKLIERMEPLDYQTCQIAWGNGQTQRHKKVLVDIKIGGIRFQNQWVIANDKHYGLIGRDLLNAYILTCDGPKRIWETNPSWL